MIGFEIEICLPVADGEGAPIAGEALLATSRIVRRSGQGEIPIFTVVSDRRSLPDGRVHSSLEFVTTAWSCVGDARRNGAVSLESTLQEIRQVRELLYRAGAVELSTAAADRLKYTRVGGTLRITPGNGYREEAGTEGNGDGLSAHYSVGVPLGGLPYVLDRLREAAPVDEGAARPAARYRLVQAKDFAAEVLRDFPPQQGGVGGARARRELDGYLQLAFTQVVAFADHVAAEVDGATEGHEGDEGHEGYERDEGRIKDGTVVLSRARLGEVFAELPSEARDFLRQRADAVIATLAGFQEHAYGDRKSGFQDGATREAVPGGPVTLLEYARAAFDGHTSISQQRVFGGMREIGPHPEGEAVVVPFEIRTLGSARKSWRQVSDDLAELVLWAQAGHEPGRA
ncbi:hypothetical protein ACIRBX_00585 [Kitasatospora sp. NPDC096147]|uniref:hypothetical protein n=1 Tax=Kitasatospora sp. NPDC096147 TaxID=3364093 RepID=UPI003826C688